jgi:hypothetical protein
MWMKGPRCERRCAGAIPIPPTCLRPGLFYPARIMAILEGESLFNDAAALLAYREALYPDGI